MGNESSSLVDDNTSPATLERRDLPSLAKYILEKDVKRIVVMVGLDNPMSLHTCLHLIDKKKTGAGISTSAGIPDFRSPDTGIYSNLAHLDLPDPEAVFDISFFRQKPEPFYTLAKELYPGRYRPTIAHSLINLLYKKGRLLKLFTQNIDCLEREAGVPGELIVEAHGSFASQHCIDCKSYYPHDLMKQVVEKGDVPRCHTPECNGLVKPDIVFFGEALPEAFFMNRTLPQAADLCIIMGTSLTVQPFASLPSFCQDETPRLLINMERVGGLGSRADDVLLLGDCDEGVRKLAEALGWLEELEALWEETNPDQNAREKETAPLKTRDERLHDEMERLAADVDRTLHISNAHHDRVRDHLSQQDAKSNIVQKADAGEATRGVCGVVSAPGKSTGPVSGMDDDKSLRREGGHGANGGLAHVFPHLDQKSSL